MFKDTAAIYSDLVKTISKGLIVLFIGGYIIYALLARTFNEFILMRFGETTSGYITSVKEDATDTDGGGVAFDFYYDYEFKLPNGGVVEGSDVAEGRIPDYLLNVKEGPYEMEVVYMKSDPEINKIKRALSDNPFTPVRRIIFSIIMSVITGYLCYRIMKPGIKQYKHDRKTGIN